MAKTTKLTQTQLEYNKQLRRIEQFIARAEKRGYRFEQNIIPPKPKRISKKSVERLSKITPEKLYKKSTALSEVTGEIVSGTVRRKEERKESAKKSVETRRKKIEQVSTPSPTFEKQRRQQDNKEKQRLKDETYAQTFSESKIVYNEINNRIDSVMTSGHKYAAQHLRTVLDSEIKTYGLDSVMQDMSSKPQQFLEACDVALRYNPGDARHDEAILEILTLIEGAIPTAQSLRELQDAIDLDTYYDFEDV